MKKVWVKAVPWSKEVALTALEGGADALWVPPGRASEVRKMGVIPILAEDGDLKVGQDVIEEEAREKRVENVENPFVNTRPFRVNAGPVHAYIRMARGQTKYLSEIRVGDGALIVNFESKSYPAVAGKAKVERCPLVLVEDKERGQTISVILQNVETIRLLQPDKKAISLTDLQEGGEVLVYREKEGRHFGNQIVETIAER